LEEIAFTAAHAVTRIVELTGVSGVVSNRN